jgi:outer membrane receptor protein involved in Fe transport
MVLSICGVTQAAVVGKIQGFVVDKKTGETLPSVAVQIEETGQGVLTTGDGHYLIMNVPPGMYTLRCVLVGYAEVEVRQVQVITGRSANVNIEMTSEAVASGIVVIVKGEKDVMEMNKPTSNVTISKEQMAAMPVQNVDEILATSVGVVRSRGELHIRGGRSGEVSYVVDGVETKDPLGGLGPTQAGMNLSSNTIEEIQIIKGGYDPEYGRAMSGIVSINTKTGTSTTEGHIELYTDNFRAPNLNKYSNSFDRVYFSLGGPEPFVAGRILPALGVDYFKDKLYYFFSIDTYKTDGNYAYKDYTSPDRQRDWLRRNVLGFDLRDRQQNSFSLTSKMTYKVTNNIKMVFNYQGIWQDETIFRWDYRYTPATAPVGNDVQHRLSVTFTHQLNKSTFYEFLVSRVYHEYARKPDDPDNPGYGLTPKDFLFDDQYESYDDKNSNGVYDEPEPFINVYYDTSYTYGGLQYNYGDVFRYIDDDEPYHLYDPWGLDGEVYRYDPEMLERDYVLVNVDTLLWDWNGDGFIDYSDGEPFVDLNNNGSWDRGDNVVNDQNGNDRFDPELSKVLVNNLAEPYTDGDINLGEPFDDLNGNGVYDEGIDRWMGSADPIRNQDLNDNGMYDGPDDLWTRGIPYIDLNANGIYDPPNKNYDEGEPFVDLNSNSKWDQGGGFLVSGYHNGIDATSEDPHFHENSAETWTFDFKLTKQVVREHELKTGFQILLRDFDFSEISNPWVRRAGDDALPDGGPYPDRGTRRDFYHHDPIEGAFFLQDVVEYGSLVARLGFRYDFFFQSNAVDTLVPHFQEFDKGAVVDSRGKISPRLGISYPISEKAKIYFNYGHFYQLPPYTRMYRRLGQDRGTIGNPNLDYQKTVQYEFGVRYNLSGDYVLDIAGFYKDIFGIVNGQRLYYVDGRESALYDFENSDYGRARGFEIQLEKRYGDFVSGSVNYTYAFAYGKASSDLANFEDLAANRKTPIKEFPLDWDVRHALNVNFGLRISRADHPKLFGFSIPNDWGLNFTWQLHSGEPFTPGDDYPNMEEAGGGVLLTNSLRKPSFSNVNVRFSKSFSMAGIDYSFQLWIDNIFDNRNIETLHEETGRPDTQSVLQGESVVIGGTDYDHVPWYLSPGRNLKVGLTMNF